MRGTVLPVADAFDRAAAAGWSRQSAEVVPALGPHVAAFAEGFGWRSSTKRA